MWRSCWQSNLPLFQGTLIEKKTWGKYKSIKIGRTEEVKKTMDKYERLDRELIHKGAIIDYYQDTMKIPNGTTAKWDFINHKGAAAVVAVKDDGRLLMVRQYRNALERETLEIPAGGLNGADEPTDIAAARELRRLMSIWLRI